MPDLSPTKRRLLRNAIHGLPEPTRAVYLAHLLRGDDFPTIAAREGLTGREVEQHLSQAILLIDRYLKRIELEAE